MKLYHLALLVLPLLLLAGCDRFDHDFTAPVQADFAQVVFQPLQAAFNHNDDPVGRAMAFFDEDYLHNGIIKSDRRVWLEGIYAQNPGLSVEVSMINAQQSSPATANVNWRLRINSATRATIVDSTFTGDRLIRENNRWYIHGNQASCTVPNPKQTAVLEYFTFLGCPNCPPAEAKLHELQELHEGRLIYLEHHIAGPLAVTGDPTYPYYNPGAVPVTLFGGQTRVPGSSADALASYEPLVNNLLQADSPLLYKDLSYGSSGRVVSGSIRLQAVAGNFDQTDLYLNVALIDKTSTYTNTQGANLHNVVRGKILKDLRTSDLSQSVSFEVQSANDLEEGMALVIFAQRRPAPFNNNATILSGMETPLSLSTKRSNNR